MRFSLIDRIDELEPGVKISAVKALSMLEAMTQVSAWLIRASEDFRHSMVVLKEARNVKYGQFVEPGQTLQVTAEIVSQTDRETVLKAQGMIDGRSTVNARLVLERYNLIDEHPTQAPADETVKQQMRALFALLWRPEARGAQQPKV